MVQRVSDAVRWCFEDRRTGRIVIAQFPNWPLWAIAVAWVVRRVVDEGSVVADIASVAGTCLWLYWGADELVRGVNPWRRLLGIGVLTWQMLGLLS
jgi:hypothetical protein